MIKKFTEQKNETVIFLHGISRSHLDMAPMDIYFQTKGYNTINIDYPSTKMSLEDLIHFVGRAMRDHNNYNPFIKTHFVTHSMGGLIMRYFLAHHRPPNLGHVVMLGTPNSGSELADILHDHDFFGGLFKAFYGPAGSQLLTTHQHIEDEIDYPLGIIAGSSNFNPAAPFIFKEQDNDGIVAVERTKVAGMTDHIIMPALHAVMMFNPDIIRQTRHFIENGGFNRETANTEIEEEVA
ncbi:MAG: hypothetical protein KTR28_01480 [Micavibrio sp.]|nr:hypothetical protein [Micavibrio sp.]